MATTSFSTALNLPTLQECEELKDLPGVNDLLQTIFIPKLRVSESEYGGEERESNTEYVFCYL